ncbi:LysR substrate-binding domain-containing protein [Actinoplanes sp. CA-030573]|uniref:LysR substrate-binding domain-containing protein n=1 Tax=Actinoplanes sp. CA-030573 TaxID=3239898 RepID=UPI003D8D4002
MDADLRLLQYFVAVAEELHFGRAAHRLYVSQPALSQQIRKLESDIGVALFVRDRRSVALTDAGSALLEPARATLAAGAAFSIAATHQARAQRSELVVGFHTRWPDNFLPRVLRDYRDMCPHVAVHLRQFDFGDTSAGLRTGETDVALIHLPVSGEEVRYEPLWNERRVIMLADDHPLAGRDEVTIAEVLAHATSWAVPPDDDPLWRDFWSAAPERAAAGGAGVIQIQPMSQEALFQVIAGGSAVALTYAAMEQVYSPPGLRFVPVANIAPAVMAVAWRVGDSRPDVGAFVTAVCRTFSHPGDEP